MDLQKQRVKDLWQKKEFLQAKQLVLQMINDGNKHYKIFEKLGDISIELNQYQDALKHYKTSIRRHQQNQFIYIKVGNLYHQHLNDNNRAQEMYKKCIKLDPNNELCWFNYGQLLFKQNKFIKSEQCYLKCITPRACVHYHHALLLLSKPSSNTKHTQQKVLNLLSKAINLKPNRLRYQHKYALCLKDNGFVQEADESFKLALALSDYKEIVVLYDYALFLWQCRDDCHSALKYLQMALDLDKHHKHQYVLDEYNNLYNYIQSISINISNHSVQIKHDENIKLIIYDFDQTITYNNLYRKVGGDINKLDSINKMDLVNNVFGGDDRLNRLHLHFKRILSSLNNVKLAILSFNHTNIIIEALGRVGLMKYFSNIDIIGSDISKYLNTTKSKLKDIEVFANKYELNICKEVLFIDDQHTNIDDAANHCKTYHVYSNFTLNGLSMKHLKEIEQIMGVYQSDHYDIPLPKKALSTTIDVIDPTIYRSIKREIGNMKNNSDSIDTLPVIQWVHNNWSNEIDKEHFLDFAQRFKIVRMHKTKGYDWSMANILPLLLKIVPTDTEIQRRYAKCLAFLAHFDEAEHGFKSILENNRNIHYLHLMEYAYFLFKRKRYNEAATYFVATLKRMTPNASKSRVYLGYARTLECMQKKNEAANYYQLAIANATKYDDIRMMHFFLRRCLSNDGQDGFCNDVDRQNDNNYVDEKNEDLSMVVSSVGSIGISVADTSDVINNIYFIEFDRFWFDKINIVMDSFNKYYDAFLKNQMNDIRYILFERTIQNDLKDKIGVKNEIHCKMIMKKIKHLRDLHNRFIEWLKKYTFFDVFYGTFQQNGIFTLESLEYNIKTEKDLMEMIDINDSQMLKKTETLWRAVILLNIPLPTPQ